MKRWEICKFDVVISTLNSERTIKACLDACMHEIPVNQIIVIDGGSTDATLEILKEFPKIICHVKPNLNLGQSRAFGFSLVKTKWFVQLDSDIILKEGWFKTMSGDMKRADVIEGSRINHYAIPHPNVKRALFGGMLIRTETIKNLKLDCLILEDELTRRIVTKRGYRWLKNGCLLADHYSNPERYKGTKYQLVVKGMHYPSDCILEMGKVDRISGFTFFHALKRFSRFYGSLLKFFLINFVETLRTSFLYLKGYLKCRN